MKNRISALVLAVVLALSACGCRKAERGEQQNEHTNQDLLQEQEFPGGAGASQATDSANEETGFHFADVENVQFVFSNGAGGWATLLTMDAQGNFFGEFYDGEMGATGEKYPNGTVYRSDFKGRFTQPVQVNDYTYSMRILEIGYAEESGKEEIRDGIRYCFGEAYGLDDAKDILIYLPGAPLAELPEEFLSWVGYYDLSNTTDPELPFYALYNEAQQLGFSGYSIDDSLKNRTEASR